jgi:hypothetical protein
MKITEAQAKRVARTLVRAFSEEPECTNRVNDQGWWEHVLQRFSEGTEYGEQSAAEERQNQREAIRDAVWSWMARVYARCPRQEIGETMELKIIADQGGYCTPSTKGGDEFEAFTFRLETTTTEGEF